MEEKDSKCPDCGKPTDWIGPKFRAPKKTNIKAWESIKVLRELGLIHFIGWANNDIDIPGTTMALKDLLMSQKASYEWNINKRITSEYSPENQDMIKHFSDAIRKIDKYLLTKP